MVTTIETFGMNPLTPAMFPDQARSFAGSFGASLTLAKGTVVAKKTSDSKIYAYAGVNRVQTITPTTAASAGHFIIGIVRPDGAIGFTGPIAYNASLANIQTALDLASGVANGVVASSAASAAPFTTPTALILTYSGTGFTLLPQSLATVQIGGDVVGTTKVTVADSTTVTGTQTPVGILIYDVSTDASGNVYFSDSSAVASASNPANSSAGYYVSGTFDPADLTGWDAGAAVALGATTLPNGYIRIP